MTRMTGPDCAVMCNLINTHTHTHIREWDLMCLKKNLNASMKIDLILLKRLKKNQSTPRPSELVADVV